MKEAANGGGLFAIAKSGRQARQTSVSTTLPVTAVDTVIGAVMETVWSR